MDIPSIKVSTFYAKKRYVAVAPSNPNISDISDTETDDEEHQGVLTCNTLSDEIPELPEGLESITSGSEYEDSSNDEGYTDEEVATKRRKTQKTQRIDSYIWTEQDIPMTTLHVLEHPIPEDVLLPLEYFTKLFSFEIMNDIISYTNLYSTQQTGKSINISPSEITDFMSIILQMGVISLPAIEDYWATSSRIQQVADIMGLKRFQIIRKFVHFNDNTKITNSTKDRYFKIRPLLEKVRQNCRNNQFENQYSIDETMIAYKGTYAGNLRQYIKNKPHKWGFKFFVRAGVSGYISDFIPYQGATTFDELKGSINELTSEERSLGVGASAVIALCKSIDEKETSEIFCDNWFSSLPLFTCLKEKLGILSLGTIRSNRIARCSLEMDKILLKRGRGSFCYRSDTEKGLIVVKWADNKCVLLASTLCGINPLKTVKRFSKIDKRKVNIPCPALITYYNKHMGGVDKANSLLGLYRSPSRSKRWYFSIFTWLLDICVINAWILYCNDCKATNRPFLPLKKFRLELAESLAKTGKESRRGRPSLTPIQNRILHPIAPRPDAATRRDCVGHWAEYTSKGRCRYCQSGFTTIICTKCNLRLCFTPKKNCFYSYHCANWQ